MVFKQFYINAWLRVILLAVTIAIFFFFLFETRFFLTAGLLFLLAIIQTWELIRQVNKTNRQVAQFLEAIRHQDFSRSFEAGDQGNTFDLMRNSFNEVLTEFRKIREEKELQYHFLQNIIQHIGIGLLAYHKNGNVQLVNNSAKRLFGMNNLRNISDLESFSHDLADQLRRIKTGQNCLVKIPAEREDMNLAILAREFKLGNDLMTLVSIQNIQHELEEQEMDSWQKLIRVLTHEIMNSMTPIVSLTSSSAELISDIRQESGNCSEIMSEILDDLDTSIRVINRRSTGLMHFVELYRNLTRIPRPNFKIFYVSDFIENIFKLFENQLSEKGIRFSINIHPGDLEITADQELLEQVVINLVRNSMQALSERPDPRIEFRAFIHDSGHLFLELEDNGEGILPEVIERIFVPFFTTKSDGSGIGLSLSKQIMRLHGGNITVHSVPGERTVFYLKF
jgi:two-component system nitrogen regulation sensor histidine kinase NtrY